MRFPSGSNLAVISDSPVNDTTAIDNNVLVPEETKPLPDTFYTMSGVFLTVTCVISLVGNMILMVTMLHLGVWKKPTVNIYIFIINVVSLVDTLFGFPFVIASNFAGRWLFGELCCEYYTFLVYTCALITITLYMLVSIHRYRVFVLRVPDDSPETRRWIWYSIAAAVTYSLCWGVSPFLGWGRYGLEPYGTSCSLDWTSKVTRHKMYNLAAFFFMLFLPIAVMVFCYTKVMKKLSMQVSTNVTSATNNTVGNNPDTTNTTNTDSHGATALVSRSLKIIMITLVTFMLSWSPYGILSMVASFDVVITPQVTALPTILAKCHSAVNPVVYLISFRHYRLPLRQLFGRGD